MLALQVLLEESPAGSTKQLGLEAWVDDDEREPHARCVRGDVQLMEVVRHPVQARRVLGRQERTRLLANRKQV